jgi:hypothetical protein
VDSTHFVGTWKLISFEAILSNGEVRRLMGNDPTGRISYDDKGNMMVALTPRERARVSSVDKTRATLAEKGAFLDSFEAYFGTYVVDEERGIVTHYLEGALFPNWTDTAQERFYSFTGERLTLSTAPIEYGGETVTGILVWQRL